MPKFEIPTTREDGTEITIADLAQSLQKGMSEFMQYMNGTVEDRVGLVRQEVTQSKQEELAQRVQKFAKEHEDFRELLPFIEPYFNAGRDIEEAYTLGKRAAGKGETKPVAKPAPAPAPSHSPSVKTDEGLDPTKIEGARKPLSVRDAARKNLDALLMENPGALDQPEE